MSKINDDIQADKLYEFKDIETEQHTKPNFIRKLLSLNSKFPSFASNDELITSMTLSRKTILIHYAIFLFCR